MRTGLLALTVLLFGSGVAIAADPPIVFQVQPFGRVLDDLRGAADHVGGMPAIKLVNKQLKEVFGEKGLEGLDINRPIVGYVILAPKPEDIATVIALPITGEKDFLALCERANGSKPTPIGKEKGVYELPPLNRQHQALMRFADQYAYIAYGNNPAAHIEAKALVPMAKLFDPAERGLAAVRVHFDRIPLAVKLAAPALFAEVKKTLFRGSDDDAIFKAIMPEVEKLLARYGKLVLGGDVLTARLLLDLPAGDIAVEATLTAKPDTELAKMIAAYKAVPNRFASLATHPDTAAAWHMQMPLFAPEVRAAAAAGLDEGRKDIVADAPQGAKTAVEEAFKGFIRVVKKSELDVAIALRGPNKDGWFHAIGAISFDDTEKPGTLEKEIKAFFQKQAPQDEQDRMKWDADKAGKVNIHTYHWPEGGFFFFDFTKFLGGDKCFAAFAFAPDGIVAVVGPDPIPVLKTVLAAKPVARPVLEMMVNPSRVVKAFEKFVGEDDRNRDELVNMIGKEDKLLSAATIAVEGGKQLKVTYTMSLRVLPRLMFTDEIRRATRNADEKPPLEK